MEVCPGNGICCQAKRDIQCGAEPEECAKEECTKKSGTWIEVNDQTRPWTCEMGKSEIAYFKFKNLK